MDKSVLAAGPKDFGTDLPMVPPGDFTDFSAFPNSTQPADVRNLPVLRGCFDAQRFDFNPRLPTHIGWGMVTVGRGIAITFRIQRGPNVLYWLANPSDIHVWEAIDKWTAAKRMVLAADFQNGQALIVHRDFDLNHPSFSDLRNATKDTGRTLDFIASVTMAFAKDEVRHIASSDIPSYPQLGHVQACMVRTEQTGGVALMLNEGEPGPNGAVADAVSALMQSMMKPTERRH